MIFYVEKPKKHPRVLAGMLQKQSFYFFAALSQLPARAHPAHPAQDEQQPPPCLRRFTMRHTESPAISATNAKTR